jgi:hypothetical protein
MAKPRQYDSFGIYGRDNISAINCRLCPSPPLAIVNLQPQVETVSKDDCIKFKGCTSVF